MRSIGRLHNGQGKSEIGWSCFEESLWVTGTLLVTRPCVRAGRPPDGRL